MSYFYLQVSRLDGKSAGEFYYPMGRDPQKVHDRLCTYLDSYREKGFSIIHFPAAPLTKHAARKKDGVRLELIVIEEERPLLLGSNVDWRGDDENHATVH